MRIGIISDTHDNIIYIRKALKVFSEQGIEFFLHAGDLISPEILKEFKGWQAKFVLGNCDYEVEKINSEANCLGFPPVKNFSEFEIDAKSFILFHGDNIPLFREAVASGKYDYIIKGHTHFSENYFSNNTRIINPGSLSNTGDHSLAILDVLADQVDFIKL